MKYIFFAASVLASIISTAQTRVEKPFTELEKQLNPAPVVQEIWYTCDGITFQLGKGSLIGTTVIQIQKIVSLLNANPGINIGIGAYTDTSGSVDINKKLSQQRADNVKAQMIKDGMPADRIDFAIGYGATDLLYPNQPGSSLNIRVAIKITKNTKQNPPAPDPAPKEQKPDTKDPENAQPLTINTSDWVHAGKPSYDLIDVSFYKNSGKYSEKIQNTTDTEILELDNAGTIYKSRVAIYPGEGRKAHTACLVETYKGQVKDKATFHDTIIERTIDVTEEVIYSNDDRKTITQINKITYKVSVQKNKHEILLQNIGIKDASIKSKIIEGKKNVSDKDLPMATSEDEEGLWPKDQLERQYDADRSVLGKNWSVYMGMSYTPSVAFRGLNINNPELTNYSGLTTRQNETATFGESGSFDIGATYKRQHTIFGSVMRIQEGFRSTNAPAVDWQTGYQQTTSSNSFNNYRFAMTGLGIGYNYTSVKGKARLVIQLGLYYEHLSALVYDTLKNIRPQFKSSLTLENTINPVPNSIVSNYAMLNAGMGIAIYPCYNMEIRLMPTVFCNLNFTDNADIRTRLYNVGLTAGIYLRSIRSLGHP